MKKNSISNFLTEGLREGDLNDMIIPLISIDEYESKVGSDDDVIVVGFFAEDEEAARDLSRFIDRSVNTIIDTDTSPAPTEEGYFMVFVEFQRDDTFEEIFFKILGEIQQLVDIDAWQFKTYGVEDIFDLSKDTLEQNVRTTNEEPKQFEIRRFLKAALIDNVRFHNDYLILEKRNMSHVFKIIDFGENAMLPETSAFDLEYVASSARLTKMLGNSYNAIATHTGKLEIFRDGTRECLVLRQT